MSQPQILLNQLSFALLNGPLLFNELTHTFSCQKTGLVGRNGIGKSTLLKLIAGKMHLYTGTIQINAKLSYIPQDVSYAPEMTVAGLLDCEEKINALVRIKQGNIHENDFDVLDDDWDVEMRIQKQLTMFGMHDIPYHRQLKMLSGGEVTKLLLAKAFLSDANFILLDEPTNHLDFAARQQLYRAIQEWRGGMIVVSHDRKLLNLMDEIVELTHLGAASYGGNYDFFVEQKAIEQKARKQQLQNAEKLFQRTKNSIQLSREKHEQKQSYGGKLKRSGSIDKMEANSKQGRSEHTQSKLLIKEERMIQQSEKIMQSAKDKIEITEEIHVSLLNTFVPKGKMILDINNIGYFYPNTNKIIIKNFNLTIYGPERIALTGDNGSGKTTLVKLILNEIKPKSGKIYLGTNHVSYLDQTGSQLNHDLSIMENFLLLNPDAKENDAHQFLAQFLFRNTAVHKLVKNLSGGEKLRALLACVLMSKNAPQLLILDEPTNHLDLPSILSIESALKNYQGSMIVISHDQKFLENINITRCIHAPFVLY